eukprot:CAMPEP_0196664574 /NCGR_PEP_ID=MMETSP1086-20130531/57608_1 /TAXON_ID=77921 /ORGANISM="Cyanoptyche  gloeocystis , Strain SAG4.97" /LENGTH=190 /DNA_ID=CAMNT_0042000947 /DNA_START=168 /DNA_END=740 /DNA_ORIENTATION=-
MILNPAKARIASIVTAGLLAYAVSEWHGSSNRSAAQSQQAMERSYIMIKPDGVHRGLIADIIKRFEQKGYTLVGIKIIHPSRDIAEEHYAEHKGKGFFPGLVNFLTSGPVIAMVWEGKGVIDTGRKLIGATNPLASAPGTIRGDFAIAVGRNIIHGSDSVESATREISLWFKPEELVAWSPVAAAKWIYE